MPSHCAGVFLYGDRLLLPAHIRVKGVCFLEVEPITDLEVSAQQLADALRSIFSREMKTIPPLKPSEYPSDPFLLRYTKMKSWKQMAKRLPTCSILKGEEGYLVEPLKLVSYVLDESKVKLFPLDTDFLEVAQYVIDCLQEEAKKLGGKPGLKG